MYRPNRIGPLPILTLDETASYNVGPVGDAQWSNWVTGSWITESRPTVITATTLGLPRANIGFNNYAIPSKSDSGLFAKGYRAAFGLPVKQTVLTDKFNFPPDGYILQVFGSCHVWSLKGMGGIVADGFYIMQTEQDIFAANNKIDKPKSLKGHRWWLPGSEHFDSIVGSSGAGQRFTHSHATINASVIVQANDRAEEGTPDNLVISASIKNISNEDTQILLEGNIGYSFYDRDLQIFDPTL